MKQYGLVYESFQEMQSFIYGKNINKKDNILIQVFTGVVETGFIENLIGEILSILPQGEIIGATTAGEIYEEKVLTNTTVISFTIFEKTKIKSKLLINNEDKSGKNIGEELIEEDTKVIILFCDGLLTNCQNIIKDIQSVNSNVIVCGGKAADNGYFKETFVFTKKGAAKNAVAAVSLSGKQLNVTTGCSFGWSTIGKLMTITKAANNRVYTIDNVKAVDVYKKYLGDQVAEGLPMSAMEFPLIVRKNGFEMAKVACSCNDDGSLSFLSNIEEDDKVQFGYGNVNMLVNQSLEIADRLKNRSIEAIFIYSCSSRRAFMQDNASLEITPLNNIAPTFGFFTYGEFFSVNNTNKLLNVTMTILGISEGEQNYHSKKSISSENESPSKDFFERKELGVIKVFTNLVNEATKELQQANEILEKQKRKTEQLNSITKSILRINSEMIISGEFGEFLQRILDKVMDIIPKGKIGSILLFGKNGVCYKAAKGYDLDKIKNITYKSENAHKFNTKYFEKLFNAVILKDLKNQLFRNAEQYNLWENMLNQSPRQLLTCGIGIDGEVAGFINIFNTEEEEDFNEEDKSLLKYICYDIAIALKNYKLLEDIINMSRHDSLTGLYNRRYFRELLNKTQDEAKLSNKSFIICMLDLNNLKIVNDTYGHDAGDEFIIRFVKAFKTAIDEKDILGRTGGDEFTVIFINKNRDEVIEIINKVRKMLESYSLDFDGVKEEISFAYGLSEFSKDAEDIIQLLKIADKRMYENKKRMKEI